MKVAGFGFRKGATADSLHDALKAAGALDVDVLATVEGKAAASCFKGLADALDVEVRTVQADALSTVAVVSQSEKSERLFGTGSLSEAAALLAAGPGARIVVARVISQDKMATCAVAEGEGS